MNFLVKRYLPRIFYVYALFRPDTGVVCYIGKGKKYRMSGQALNPGNIHLKRIIAKCGKPLIGVKVRVGLTEKEALEIEIALIAAVGRRCDGGPLVNMSSGGENAAAGSRRDTPWIFTEEWKRNLSIAAKKRVRPKTYPLEHRAAIAAGVAAYWASVSKEVKVARMVPARKVFLGNHRKEATR